jgi:NTP pyrophosphatase (non-canonical NTP hydrolase)
VADRVALGRLNRACRKAVRLWGVSSQLRQLQEECGELVAAVNRADRGRGTENLVEEIADVVIMSHQARLMFGPAVEEAIARKLARLEERIAHPKNAAALRGATKEARRGR